MLDIADWVITLGTKIMCTVGVAAVLVAALKDYIALAKRDLKWAGRTNPSSWDLSCYASLHSFLAFSV